MPKRVVIPTLLTLGNAVCGLAAIAFASKIGRADTVVEAYPFYLACAGWFIIAAMVFDMLDGIAARLTRTAGPFGAELDSLCDAISFGVAPAFLLIQLGPGWEQPMAHQALVVVAALYMMATILRLARFNVENGKPNLTGGKRFRGLPSPAAAGCIASLAILRGSLVEHWPALDSPRFIANLQLFATWGALLVAALMVSDVPYPHLTRSAERGRKMLRGVLSLVPLVAICFLVREGVLVACFWAYALGGLFRHLIIRAWKRSVVPATAGHDLLSR